MLRAVAIIKRKGFWREGLLGERSAVVGRVLRPTVIRMAASTAITATASLGARFTSFSMNIISLIVAVPTLPKTAAVFEEIGGARPTLQVAVMIIHGVAAGCLAIPVKPHAGEIMRLAKGPGLLARLERIFRGARVSVSGFFRIALVPFFFAPKFGVLVGMLGRGNLGILALVWSGILSGLWRRILRRRAFAIFCGAPVAMVAAIWRLRLLGTRRHC